MEIPIEPGAAKFALGVHVPNSPDGTSWTRRQNREEIDRFVWVLRESRLFDRVDYASNIQDATACMNHCPVYARIGGLAYGTTYPGPIGSIISPHLLGLEPTQDLPTASSLCGACAEVCPVGIPIPELLMQLRHAAKHDAAPGHAPLAGQASAKDWKEALAWQAWAKVNASPALYATLVGMARRLRALTPPWQAGWTAHRTPLRPAARGLRERLRSG